MHPSSRQQWIDEVQAEISMCLGMLYPIVEVFRNDDEFAEELSTCPFFPCTGCVSVNRDRLTFSIVLSLLCSEHGATLAHILLPNVGEPQR